MAGRIWFDVTTMMRWQRPPVGIVRVERECARAMLLRRPDAISFCLTENGRLVQIEPLDVKRKLAADVSLPASHDGAPADSNQLTFRRILGAVRRRIIAARGRGHDRRQDAAINEGDVYLSMGLDWDDKDQSLIEDLRNRNGVRVVRMCYDLIPVKFPELTHPSARDAVSSGYFAALARNADTILCISVNTRDDLSAYLKAQHIADLHLSVIRLGTSVPESGSADRPEMLGDREFILYVSTIEARKNHEILVRAYQRLVDNGLGELLPALVFVGMKGWGVDSLLAHISTDRRVKDRILLLDRVSDAELNLLYSQCRFTVFPSRYEGWGLGVSESLAHGKFCISSNAGALTEAGGDLAEYVDPDDVAGWAERLLYYSQDAGALADREEAISLRFAPSTWRETADQVLSLCAGVAVS